MPTDRGTATLIVNPVAGRASLLKRHLPSIEKLLEQHGLVMRLLVTSSKPDSAEQLARVVARTPGIVIACGGDGTVNGALQGAAHSQTPLGVLPLGTANALGRHLRIPLDPLNGIASLLSAKPTRVPIGQIKTGLGSRYFLVMAGCGPDGALVHKLSSEAAQRIKRRFGRASYYAHAGGLFLTRRWPSFVVAYRVGEVWRETTACAVLASRLPNLGGLFTGLTRRADFLAATLHLQVMAPPVHLSLAAWFTLSRMGVRHPWQRTVNVDDFRCSPIGDTSTYVQADAELLGLLPFSARVVPDALTLLLPDTER